MENEQLNQVSELVGKQNRINEAIRRAKSIARHSNDPEGAAFASLTASDIGMPAGWLSIRAASIADDVLRSRPTIFTR